jgi:general secretion pathway protein D
MRFRRDLVVVLAALAALTAPAGRPSIARAQGLQRGAGATLVTGVAPTDPSPSESRAIVSFNAQIPQFSIISNDTAAPVVVFADTRLTPSLYFPGGKHGLVQSMTFVQNGANLTLTITGVSPIHLSAFGLAGRAIAISITGVGAPSPVPEPGAPGSAVRADEPAGELFEVVRLKYADVSEIVGLLTANQGVKPNDNFTPQEPAFGSAGMQGPYVGAGMATPAFNAGFSTTSPPVESVGQAVDETFGIDRRLNAIILRGSPAHVARIKAEIAKLDVAVGSVLLETVFVELTEAGARNVGLDFNNANNQVATVAYSYASGDYPGVSNTHSSGGVSLNLQAALYAQIAKGNGRIISKPRISAQSGSTAKIITGDALPILTSIALSGVNAVQQEVQYVNVGVTLQIAPRVSEDGFVTSHVFAEVSSVTGFSQGYPTISQREASTSATVRDGDSFIIGGLIQEGELSHHNKIPGAGDLPLLGELFKSENSSKSKTDLYIVVTPHIVQGRNALAATSQEDDVRR